MRSPERRLDRAITKGRITGDAGIDEMAGLGDRLAGALASTPGDPARDRDFFVAGVSARRKGFLLYRATAGLAMAALVVVAMLARGAVPGEGLFPIRKALASANLVRSSAEEVQRRLQTADDLLDRAEGLLGRAPLDAQDLARRSLVELGEARNFLTDLGRSDRNEAQETIVALEERAFAVIRLTPGVVTDPAEEDSAGPGSEGAPGEGGDDSPDGDGHENEPDDDNSGPGSDDDDDEGRREREIEQEDEDEDNSGPGSGEKTQGETQERTATGKGKRGIEIDEDTIDTVSTVASKND